jgi:glucose-6-phosphate 1-epimerase
MTDPYSLPGVSRSLTANNLAMLELDSEYFEARLSLQGGQLLSFRPKNQHPLLYLSPLARYAPNQAIRGGIPLCWPWFGPHPSESQAPQHGIGRTSTWSLRKLITSVEGFELILSGPAYGDLAVEIRYCLGQEIQIELTTHNRGANGVRFGAALHSYLAISDLAHISVHGLGATRYFDKLGKQTAWQVDDALKCNAPLDRLYYTRQPLELHDQGWLRRIRIETQGSASAILWNPGSEKPFNDLAPGDWRRFFCIETANAGEDEQHLSPGQTHTLGARLYTIPL